MYDALLLRLNVQLRIDAITLLQAKDQIGNLQEEKHILVSVYGYGFQVTPPLRRLV